MAFEEYKKQLESDIQDIVDENNSIKKNNSLKKNNKLTDFKASINEELDIKSNSNSPTQKQTKTMAKLLENQPNKSFTEKNALKSILPVGIFVILLVFLAYPQLKK